MTARNFAHDELLINCLDMWEADFDTEQIIAQNLAMADELVPILNLLLSLTTLSLSPSQEAKAASRTLFLSRARLNISLN